MNDDGKAISREQIEEHTRLWLEGSYLQSMARLAQGWQPNWAESGDPRNMSRYSFQEIQRKLKIFRWLDRLRFESFIDVGSGFDVYPALVKRRYGVRSYFADFAHSMNLPYGLPGEPSGKRDLAITLNAARLPFADDTFDVVLASEVLEHLVRPVEVIAELIRVSRKCVLMTSLEALSVNTRERWRQHLNVDTRKPHIERNFLVLDEFDALFGPHWAHENLFFNPTLPVGCFEPEPVQEAAYAALRDAGALESALCRAVSIDDHRPGALGILLVKSKAGADAVRPDPAGDAALARWLMQEAAEFERQGIEVMRAMRAGTAELPEPERPIAAELLPLLRCPDCRGAVERYATGVRCRGCTAVFAGEYGVPIMYPKGTHEGRAATEECLQRICGGDPLRRRIVRRLMRRLRRNEGPPGLLRRAAARLVAG